MQFFCALDGLRAASCIELRQYVRDVRFDRACRDVEAVGDLLIRESLSYQLENLVFAFADPECAEICFVDLKWTIGFDNFWACEAKAGPNSKGGEYYCNRPNIEFERNVPDEKPVFDEL